MAPPDRKVRGKSFGNANAYLYVSQSRSGVYEAHLLVVVLAAVEPRPFVASLSIGLGLSGGKHKGKHSHYQNFYL